jgi:hypothetical protein
MLIYANLVIAWTVGAITTAVIAGWSPNTWLGVWFGGWLGGAMMFYAADVLWERFTGARESYRLRRNLRAYERRDSN